MKKIMLVLLSVALVSLSIASCGGSKAKAKIEGATDGFFELPDGKSGEAYSQDLTITLTEEKTKAIAANTDIKAWLGSEDPLKDTGLALSLKTAVAADATSIVLTIGGTPSAFEQKELEITIPGDCLAGGKDLKADDKIKIKVDPVGKADKSEELVAVKGQDGDLTFTNTYTLGKAKLLKPAATTALSGKAIGDVIFAADAKLNSWFGLEDTADVQVTAAAAIKEGDTSFQATFTLAKAKIDAKTASSDQKLKLTIPADYLSDNGGLSLEIPDAARVYVYVADDAKPASAAISAAVTVGGNVYTPIAEKEVTVKLTNDVFKRYIPAENADGQIDYSAWVTGMPTGLKATLKASVEAVSDEATFVIKGTPEETKAAVISIDLPANILASGANGTATKSDAKFEIKAGAKVLMAPGEDKLSIKLWRGKVVNDVAYFVVEGQTLKTDALTATDVLNIPTAVAAGLRTYGLTLEAEEISTVPGGTTPAIKASLKGNVPANAELGKAELDTSVMGAISIPASFFSDTGAIAVPVAPLVLEANVVDSLGGADVKKLTKTAKTIADGGTYVEARQANAAHATVALNVPTTGDDKDVNVITVTLDCLAASLESDSALGITASDTPDKKAIGIGIKPSAKVNDITKLTYKVKDNADYKFKGDGSNSVAGEMDDVYEAKTLCGLSDGEFVLWIDAATAGTAKEFEIEADDYAPAKYKVVVIQSFEMNANMLNVVVGNADYVQLRQGNIDTASASVSVAPGAGDNAGKTVITVNPGKLLTVMTADKDFNPAITDGSGNSDHKWFGIGLNPFKINQNEATSITALTYNKKTNGAYADTGYRLAGDGNNSDPSSQDDVYEAKTLCNLPNGYFVLWIDADAVNTTSRIANEFKLSADGYVDAEYVVIVNGLTD